MKKILVSRLLYLMCMFVNPTFSGTSQTTFSIVRQQSIVHTERKLWEGLLHSEIACSRVCFKNKCCLVGYFHPISKRCALYCSNTLASNSTEDGLILINEGRKHFDVQCTMDVTSCYYFSTEILPWTQARDFCHELDGYLAEITSSTENAYLRSEVEKRYQYTTVNEHTVYSFWTGLTKVNTQWIWTNSGAQMTYSNWYPGEPNDAGDLCVHIAHHVDFKWNDNLCSMSEYFICEISA